MYINCIPLKHQKSCLLLIKMFYKTFIYKKNPQNPGYLILFPTKKNFTNKHPLKIIILNETLTDEGYKIVVIRTTNRFYSCPFTLSLIGIITLWDFYCSPAQIFSQLCPCRVPVHIIYWWSNTLSTAASVVQNVIRILFLFC